MDLVEIAVDFQKHSKGFGKEFNRFPPRQKSTDLVRNLIGFLKIRKKNQLFSPGFGRASFDF